MNAPQIWFKGIEDKLINQKTSQNNKSRKISDILSLSVWAHSIIVKKSDCCIITGRILQRTPINTHKFILLQKKY